MSDLRWQTDPVNIASWNQENGSSVNRLGLAEFKSASVLSLRSSTLTRASFQHNGGSELRLLALWHCE